MDTCMLVHVILSLIGIVAGLIVLFGLFGSKLMNGWTPLFLAATVLTSVTGFRFPFHGITPAALAIAARDKFHLTGAWRWIYVVGAVVALYSNCLALVVQSFLPIPALHALAPNGSEPPFAIAQGIVLVLFLLGGVLAARRFRPELVRAA
jgi:hypothetical protein